MFMCLPPRFEMELANSKVCSLKKSLYSLKQSSRGWFKCFQKAITSYDYTQNQVGHTIFYWHFENNKTTILIVYVDDVILTGNDEEVVDLKSRRASEFQIKDLRAFI